MSPTSELKSLLESSFKFQKFIFYGTGVVTGLTGLAILLLSVLIPPKPGEENIVLILQGVSVLFLVFAVAFPLFIRGRLQKVKNLIFIHADQIAEVKSYTVTRRGIPGFAVRIHTKDNKMLGFNVPDPKIQARITELITKLV